MEHLLLVYKDPNRRTIKKRDEKVKDTRYIQRRDIQRNSKTDKSETRKYFIYLSPKYNNNINNIFLIK